MLEDGSLSAFEVFGAGPVPDTPLIPEGDWTSFIDDVTGTPLEAAMVQAARMEEIKWVKQEKIYSKVPLSQCMARTGKAPIDYRWIDVNKGDDLRQNYRSRIVAREIKARKALSEKLPEADLFASMPPIEDFYLLVSLAMSLVTAISGKRLKLGFFLHF